VHTIATLLVFADIAGNANKLKVIVVAFAICAVIAYLAASSSRATTAARGRPFRW
jgi:gamma-glutamylcysteine synthetase